MDARHNTSNGEVSQMRPAGYASVTRNQMSCKPSNMDARHNESNGEVSQMRPAGYASVTGGHASANSYGPASVVDKSTACQRNPQEQSLADRSSSPSSDDT
eukprot:10770123-Karenia_brevis.AAC.1